MGVTDEARGAGGGVSEGTVAQDANAIVSAARATARLNPKAWSEECKTAGW